MTPDEQERLERLLSESAAGEHPPEALRRRVLNLSMDHAAAPSGLLHFLRFGTAAAAALCVALLLATSGSRPSSTSHEKAAVPPLPGPGRLAYVQEAIVGSLVAQDEEGRPVGELGLQQHLVSVEILDGIAKTTVEENFQNHTDRRLEGTFHFPLPPDASISRLALEVNGKIEEGTCLERERAREVFESIVRRMKDPALLEWMPGGIFKCRIFPIEPHATKRVIVAYTQALPYFRGKMTYVYPLVSEKTKEHPPEELRIDVRARFSGALTRMDSPSHHVDVRRRDANEAGMTLTASGARPTSDFVVTLETADDELRFIPHKVDGEDGYFALFLSPRGEPERRPGRYVFVLDISASVTAPELEVARSLVRAMMEKRIEGDRFVILAHHIQVESSGEVDLRAANDFMDRLRPIGGSDVARALQEAPEGELIYIGKGHASFGETDPSKIREALKGRQIRSIAVGSRANTPLLEKLGGHFRVSPSDDVPARVREIAATLGSPVLSEIRVEGGEAVYDVVGGRDLFFGERLVLTGRYRGPAAKLVVIGQGYRREFAASFPAKEEGNNYVRRLWAQQKVAGLLAQGESKKQEVTDLGVKHQIMTPYTSFLVLENEQMWKDHQLKREVQKQDQVLSVGERARGLLEEATNLYKQGKFAEAGTKFEEAFQLNPSSDQVYALIQRAGNELLGRMMNAPDRKIQDMGRRLMELSKSEEPALHVPATPKSEPPRSAPAPVPLDPTSVPVTKPVVSPPEPLKFDGERSGKSTEIPDSSETRVEPRLAPKRKAVLNPFPDARSDGRGIEERWSATGDQTFDELPFGEAMTANVRLRSLSSAGADFRPNDRDWNNVNDFWTADVAGLYSMTGWTNETLSARSLQKLREAEMIGGRDELQLIELSVRSADDGSQGTPTMHVHFNLDHDAHDHPIDLADIGSLKPQDRGQVPTRFWMDNGEVNEKDKVVVEKLRSLLISIDMTHAPLTAIMDYIRKISGLNIHISGVEHPDAQRMSIKAQDISPGALLHRLLEPYNLTYVVRDGVVLVTTSTAILRIESMSEDGAKIIVAGLEVGVGRVLAVTRDSKFVALVRIERAQGSQGEARVLNGLAVGRILPGDRVTGIPDLGAYVRALPAELRAELASRINENHIRMKMGMKE